MQDNISVIIATILAVIIIVIFPIYNVATRQDSITNNMIVKSTTNFVDEVRSKGYITEERYQEYIDEISATNNMYDVEMEIYAPKLLEAGDATDTYEEEYEITYTKDILKEITGTRIDLLATDSEVDSSTIKTNVYRLNEGDKFYVRVKNTNITQAQVLLNKIFGGSTDSRIVVNYGGVVYSSAWEVSEYKNSSQYNVKISRPQDLGGNEYKYEQVFVQSEDPDTNKENVVYGIAARLEDDRTSLKRGIKFVLEYSGVQFLDIYGNPTGNTTTIANQIKDKLTLHGFKANNIAVKAEGSNNKYTVTIELTDIELYYGYTISAGCYVQIGEGSAEAIIGKNDDGTNKTAAIGAIKSKEFVVFYEVKALEIEYAIDYYNENVTGIGKVYKARVNVKLNKSNDNIETIKYSEGTMDNSYFISGNGTSIKDSYNSTDDRYSFVITDNGTYTIYAKDNSGKEALITLNNITGIGSDKLIFTIYWNGSIVKDLDSYMEVLDKNRNSLGTVFYRSKTYNSNGTKITLNQDVTGR